MGVLKDDMALDNIRQELENIGFKVSIRTESATFVPIYSKNLYTQTGKLSIDIDLVQLKMNIENNNYDGNLVYEKVLDIPKYVTCCMPDFIDWIDKQTV